VDEETGQFDAIVTLGIARAIPLQLCDSQHGGGDCGNTVTLATIHGRACPGHPDQVRMAFLSGMAGTRPGMTGGKTIRSSR
jgi:hypothetical protein